MWRSASYEIGASSEGCNGSLHLAGEVALLDQLLAPGRQPFHLGLELRNPLLATLLFVRDVLELLLVLGDGVLQYLGSDR